MLSKKIFLFDIEMMLKHGPFSNTSAVTFSDPEVCRIYPENNGNALAELFEERTKKVYRVDQLYSV